MLGNIKWGALSALSFGLFFTLPSGPSGPNYFVLVPGFIALAASMLQTTQFRNGSTHKLAMPTPRVFDDAVIAEAEKLKRTKAKEEERMLRHQSSRRRAARR